MEERNTYWSLQFFQLLLNLASVSGESYSSVLVKHGERRGELDQDELEKIIYGVSKFKKVDVTVRKVIRFPLKLFPLLQRMHHKLVIVSSDLLLTIAGDQLPAAWNEYQTLENNFKSEYFNHKNFKRYVKPR